MKKILMFCMLAFGVYQYAMAQQTALTADGKLVILYENGTWTYADAKVPANDSAQKSGQTVEGGVSLSLATAQEDNSPIVLKDASIERKAFIEGPSPKLAKYFKEKNIVRCDFTLSSKDGKPTLKTEWKIMTGEAYSYFGYIRKGAVLNLELVGGKQVDLVYNKEFEPKEYQNYGFSTYAANLDLTEDQIRILRKGIVLKATMNWSRRSEEYKVVAPSYFIKSFSQIIQK